MKITFQGAGMTPEILGLKLGIVRLGRAVGKTKYTLLDERDIELVQKYAFEARVNIDRNGKGAVVYAWAYDISKGKHSGNYLQELIWEVHKGGVAPGYKVVHKNRITVDNRLENLSIVSKTSTLPLLNWTQHEKELSLYWIAINQLPGDPLEETVTDAVFHSYFINVNGEEFIEDEDFYFECKYPPCTNIEQEMRQFSICGRCQGARYCGSHCQQKDWPVHKKFCRERKRLQMSERLPER